MAKMDWEQVGFTTEKYAEICCEMVETLLKQIDINACIREINARHPELTDEQRALLQLDKQYSQEELDHSFQEAFESGGGLKQYITQALTGSTQEAQNDEPEKD